MGTLTLSGVLKRPVSGDVIPNARITFDAIATGSVVLKGVSSSCKTVSDGSYTVDLEYGDYAIQVSWAGQTQQYGTVHIDDTTPIGSLNDLLMQEIMESQLTPEIILEFRQLEQEMQEDLAQMEDLNGQASNSAGAAAGSAAAAKTSETNSAASEDASAASAAAAKSSETNSAASEDASAASAAAAKTSETNSAASEDASAASAAAAKTSETNSAASEDASAAAAAAAKSSETNSAASEGASAASAAAAKTSETNSAASEDASANSETNAKNARDAAEEYANEARDAASKVTAPLTDQGQWAISSGYPAAPSVASVWQITDGGVDPVNAEIIWDPGDMLVYLASTGVWCRLLGQQTVAGEPVPIKFDSDIILNVGAGLQIVATGTTVVDVARLDTDNNLVLGDIDLPGIILAAADPTKIFVMGPDETPPDGVSAPTKSRIYSEAFPPPSSDGTAASHDVTTSSSDPTPGRVLKVGDGGLLGMTLAASDANLADTDGLVSMMFNQGGGSSNIHFGGYGCGVHLLYGSSGDGTQALSANLFVDSYGNLSVEWLAIKKSDGSVVTQHLQKTVFESRKVNGHALTADISVTAQDIFNGQAVGIGDAADLNAYTTAGLYYQPANAQASTGKNYPEANAGSLEVYKHAGLTQIYRIYNSSRSYIRSLYGSAWSAWAKQYDTANKPTAAEVGALASGGTAAAATKLATARTIAGHAFDGTANISIAAGDVGALPSGSTAVAATKLATARTIAGHAFDGTANIAISASDVGALTSLVPAAGGVGEVSLMYSSWDSNPASHGVSLAGSVLKFAGAVFESTEGGGGGNAMLIRDAVPSGTWRCTGSAKNWSAWKSGMSTFQRIS